jgi:hypothetical protein
MKMNLLNKINSPNWTVLYNIDSKTKWVGTGWEFFDTEEEAKTLMKKRQAEGHCCGMRPFNEECDRKHMGATHQRSITEKQLLSEDFQKYFMNTNTACNQDLEIAIYNAIKRLEEENNTNAVNRCVKEILFDEWAHPYCPCNDELPEWISVKDKLPKCKKGANYSDLVLTYDISLGYGIELCTNDKFYTKLITHWMPLPGLPQEDTNNDSNMQK